MGQQLSDKIGKFVGAVHNIGKAIGPFLISQSERASKEYVKHRGRLASVDVMKEVLIAENKMLLTCKETLVKKYIDSDDMERIRIARDIQEIDERVRSLKINVQALEYLPDDSQDQSDSGDDVPEIQLSWLDRFHEFTKLNNEPWREDLLARALAREASMPGTVSPRALWIIGTLEEELFNIFAALLDISPMIGRTPVIPNTEMPAINIVIPKCRLGNNLRVGDLLFRLSETGLISDIQASTKIFRKGKTCRAEYGEARNLVRCVGSDLVIFGVIYTNTGDVIASFYDRQPNDVGSDIYQKWLNSLNKVNYFIDEID